MSHRIAFAGVLLGLLSLQAEASIETGGLAATPVLGAGESLAYYAPHHSDAAPPHGPTPHPAAGTGGTHYFVEAADGHHFAWGSVTPASSGTLTIFYDFRPLGPFANAITAGQKANAVAAMSAMSAATDGGSGPKLIFVQDTVGPASGLVNIGTGDLAALGAVSGPGGTLGLGGGIFNHSGATHSISFGVAWQDVSETWDETIGNANPAGTFDYFTVVFQEIGHAIGLGHTDNTGSLNLMNGSYTVEQTAPTAIDISHIQSVYGVSGSVSVSPEPGSITIWSILTCLVGLVFRRPRRRAGIA